VSTFAENTRRLNPNDDDFNLHRLQNLKSHNSNINFQRVSYSSQTRENSFLKSETHSFHGIIESTKYTSSIYFVSFFLFNYSLLHATA
jgi:hypothetical protein